MSEFNENTLVCGIPAKRIAGVIEAEGGVFAGRCREALVAIAQAMYDMNESGKFGTGLARVLRYHFAPPEEKFHPDCLDAVREVFFEGKKRNENWKILQFRSFRKYADGQGEPDAQKTASLLAKYTYLGKDGISPEWGHFYFGKMKTYKVQVGAYVLQSNADRMLSYMKGKGIPAVCVREENVYKVRVGAFMKKKDAEDYLPLLAAFGIRDAFIVYGY